MPSYVALILGLVVALTCTVLLLVLVTPEKRRNSLNKFFVILHDFFNFKFLVLEIILKVLYMFTSLFLFGFGFFLLFSGESYGYGYYGGFQSYALRGLLIMILGPVITRIVYESMMMLILIAKNTIDINNKLRDANPAHQAGNPFSPKAGQPANPVNPANPGRPLNPGYPVNPGNPNPGYPVNPGNPNPGNPGNPTNRQF